MARKFRFRQLLPLSFGALLSGCTGVPDGSRTEAERILIRRLAEVEEEARRQEAAIFTFEEAAFRYLKQVAHKSSADTIDMLLDQPESATPFNGSVCAPTA